MVFSVLTLDSEYIERYVSLALLLAKNRRRLLVDAFNLMLNYLVHDPAKFAIIIRILAKLVGKDGYADYEQVLVRYIMLGLANNMHEPVIALIGQSKMRNRILNLLKKRPNDKITHRGIAHMILGLLKNKKSKYSRGILIILKNSLYTETIRDVLHYAEPANIRKNQIIELMYITDKCVRAPSR